MKKNITLIFFSLIFVFFLIYLLVYTWVTILEKYKDKNNFTNIENVNFHEKYSNKMHHLRGKWPEYKKDLIWDKEDYLFTVFSHYKNNSKNYLIQGDSWAEIASHKKVFIFLAEGTHKIKKKAEQIACNIAVDILNKF